MKMFSDHSACIKHDYKAMLKIFYKWLMRTEELLQEVKWNKTVISEMKQLKNVYFALLPSGGTYTMDSLEAAEAICPKVVVPMHRWDTDPKEYENALKLHHSSR